MPMRITMTQTRMGEAGSLLVSGSTYTVSDQFGQAMVPDYATDTDNVLKSPVSYPVTLNAAGTALVSADGIPFLPIVSGLSTTSSAAAASANVAKIQAALTAGGLVQLAYPGTYEINAALVIGSNTRLLLGPATEIKQRAGTNGNLLVTSAYAASWNAVTLAWSSGTEVTVTWTAHGMTEGEYVWLDNTSTASAEQSKFKGPFRVVTTADANTLTVHVDRLPSTAPTGTWQAKRCTVNAEVVGGIWNYNNAENPGTTDLGKHALMIAGTANSSVHNLTVINCVKYGILTCGNRGLKIDEITANDTGSGTTSDSIKVYGPDYGTEVNGVYGVAGDDCVSVQTKEPAAFFGHMPAYGDCIGTKFRNINSGSVSGSTSGAVIYCSPNEYMGGIEIDGVHGRFAGQAVRLQPGDNFAGAQLASATVRGVDANSTNAVRVGGGTGTSSFQVGRVTIEKCEHNPRALTDGFIDVSSIVVAKQLRVTDSQSAVGSLTSPTWPTGAAATFISVSGAIDLLDMDGCEMNAVAANGRFVQLANASSVRRVNVRGSRLSGNQGVNLLATPAQTPDVLLEGNDMDLTYGVNAPVSVNVVAMGNTLNGATVLVRQTAGTATLAHGGNKLNGTAALTSGTVSATAW